MIRRTPLLLLLGIAATAFAVQEVTLRYNPPEGKTYVYDTKVVVEQSMVGMDMTVEQAFTTTTKVVSNKDGKVVTEGTTSDLKVKVNPDSPLAGREAEMEKMMEGVVVVTVSDHTGKPLSIEVKGGQPQAAASMKGVAEMLGMLALPKEPVREGYKWKSSVDMGKMMRESIPGAEVKDGVIPVELSLAKIEDVDGHRAAKLEFTMKGEFTVETPQITMKTSVDSKGHVWTELATGMALETVNETSSVTMYGDQELKQKNTTTQKLRKQ